MASAIIGGLANQGINKQNIIVSEPWDVNREKIAATGVRTTTSNIEAGQDADLIIIAVKPQIAKTVCEELGGSWSHRSTLPIVVSIAAGVTLDSLREWLKTSEGKTAPVVRVMPNTPALVGEGASGLYASKDVKENEKQLVDALLGSVSKATEWVDKEELLDVVTGLSGKLPTCIPMKSPANTNIRLGTCVLLRYGRTPYRQCNCSGTPQRAGYSTG